MGEPTPGPWEAADGGIYARRGPDDRIRIASGLWPADANLMAAAPELRDALLYALSHGQNPLRVAEVQDKAHAALQKARGEQPHDALDRALKPPDARAGWCCACGLKGYGDIPARCPQCGELTDNSVTYLL